MKFEWNLNALGPSQFIKVFAAHVEVRLILQLGMCVGVLN